MVFPFRAAVAQQVQVDSINVNRNLERMKFLVIDGPDSHDEYHKTSLANLAQLYWRLGALDTADDTAIEQYLFITECNLFTAKSGSGDWRAVKMATHAAICKKKDDFINRFEIVAPVSIGKLDKEKNVYEVNANSVMADVRQLDMSRNLDAAVCGSTDDIKNYPRGLIVNLDKPYSFRSVPASPEIDEFVKSEHTGAGTTVYLRLKVRADRYIDTISYNNHWHARVKGSIEGYEIYADPDEVKILFAEEIKDAAPRVVKKQAPAAPAAAAEEKTDDAGGGLGDLYHAEEGAKEENPPDPVDDDEDDCGAAKGALPF
jgi:hypothetical protein